MKTSEARDDHARLLTPRRATSRDERARRRPTAPTTRSRCPAATSAGPSASATPSAARPARGRPRCTSCSTSWPTPGSRRIPRVLGIDDRDREILTFLPGRVLDIGRETLSDAQVRSAMHWLREYHAVVAGFPRESRRWRFVERALRPGEIVCHHDSAMYNMAFDGDELAGVFDWDVAGPGIPLDDVAIFAWNTARAVPRRGRRPRWRTSCARSPTATATSTRTRCSTTCWSA